MLSLEKDITFTFIVPLFMWLMMWVNFVRIGREREREREREKYMRPALLLKVMLFVDSLNLTEKKRFPCF